MLSAISTKGKPIEELVEKSYQEQVIL